MQTNMWELPSAPRGTCQPPFLLSFLTEKQKPRPRNGFERRQGKEEGKAEMGSRDLDSLDNSALKDKMCAEDKTEEASMCQVHD